MIDRIIPIVIILIAGGIFFAYVNPTYTGDIATMRGQIKSYDGALAAAAIFKEKQSIIKEQQSKIPTEGLSRLQAFLPDDVDNVQLILDLNVLANRSGLKLSGFNVVKNEAQAGGVPREDGASTDSLDITVTGTGDYRAFRSFLSSMEGSLRPLDLITLTISTGQTGQYSYQMKFRIYWLR